VDVTELFMGKSLIITGASKPEDSTLSVRSRLDMLPLRQFRKLFIQLIKVLPAEDSPMVSQSKVRLHAMIFYYGNT